MVAWGLHQTADDEMSIYYSQNYRFDSHHLRRGVFRLDGIASAHAGFEGGELVTKPIRFTGKRLFLNYSSSASGGIRVEIQDVEGRPIEQFAFKNAKELYGDEIEEAYTWTDGSDVSSLAGQPVRLRFVLKDCDLAAGTQVHAYSVLEGVRTIGACDIGPFARLRPGTVLAEDSRVGNFVEVKNSSLGRGSKASHLSYIGDTQVGERANIGAGTITCNYDGANKHDTLIDDDAFIGSGTQLVAPVRVGEGATIGAGSTVTKNVPAGALAVTRAKQTTVKGWKRPRKGDTRIKTDGTG